jgi:hypothetical protein
MSPSIMNTDKTPLKTMQGAGANNRHDDKKLPMTGPPRAGQGERRR